MAPDGYMTISRFAKEHQFSLVAAQKFLGAHREELGALEIFYIRGRALEFLSPEQQDILLSAPGVSGYLEERGRAHEKQTAPEGYMALDRFAKEHQFHRDTAKRLLEKRWEELGDLETFSVRGRAFEFLSPEQQGILLSDRIEEGYLSVSKFAEINGLNLSSVLKRIAHHRELTGDMVERKIGGGKFGRESLTARYLSPEQQRLILDDIRARQSDELPEDYLSANAFRKKHGISQYSFNKFISSHGAEPGEMGRFSQNTMGLSPEQQQVILQGIQKQGKDK